MNTAQVFYLLPRSRGELGIGALFFRMPASWQHRRIAQLLRARFEAAIVAELTGYSLEQVQGLGAAEDLDAERAA